MIVREFHKVELEGPMDKWSAIQKLLEKHHWRITEQGPKQIGIVSVDKERFFVSAERGCRASAGEYLMQELSDLLKNPRW